MKHNEYRSIREVKVDIYTGISETMDTMKIDAMRSVAVKHIFNINMPRLFVIIEERWHNEYRTKKYDKHSA